MSQTMRRIATWESVAEQEVLRAKRSPTIGSFRCFQSGVMVRKDLSRLNKDLEDGTIHCRFSIAFTRLDTLRSSGQSFPLADINAMYGSTTTIAVSSS